MRRWCGLVLSSVVALGGCGASNDDEGDVRNTARAATSASGDEPEPSDAREHEQSDAEAEQSDLELIAAGNGWTLDEARLQNTKGDVLGRILEQLSTEMPEVLVGGALGLHPSEAPRLYIKGPASERVREIVATAPFDVIIVDLQPYSSADIEERQSQLVAVLIDLGYMNFGVGTDIQREGLMEATVQRIEGAPDDVDAIFAVLPAHLRERTSITLVDEPVYTSQ